MSVRFNCHRNKQTPRIAFYNVRKCILYLKKKKNVHTADRVQRAEQHSALLGGGHGGHAVLPPLSLPPPPPFDSHPTPACTLSLCFRVLRATISRQKLVRLRSRTGGAFPERAGRLAWAAPRPYSVVGHTSKLVAQTTLPASCVSANPRRPCQACVFGQQ